MASTLITSNTGELEYRFDRLKEYILERANTLSKNNPEFTFSVEEIESYLLKVHQNIEGKDIYTKEQVTNLLILTALDKVDTDAYKWSYLATSIKLKDMYKKYDKVLIKDKGILLNFSSYIKQMVFAGCYNEMLLSYSEEELAELEATLDFSRDYKFDFVGLINLHSSYLYKNRDKVAIELPQHRFMIIAMHLMVNEKPEKRIELVKEHYWATSNHFMTVATPTFANAGKTHGQLSSCFIDTVGDSLRQIYDSNTDVAQLSKGGGGIGVYLGKVRALGSDIRGFKGVASGVIPWMRQLNNTATSVDQVGQRPGAISPYLDVHHYDTPEFLEVKLNNGDERMRTHDLFPGVCIPDLFMEKARDREDWYMFDPYTIKKVLGFELEDYYDEVALRPLGVPTMEFEGQTSKGSYRDKYQECVDAALEGKLGDMYRVMPAIDIMKSIMRSQLETGTPYMFFRDEVNRMNPNKHAGFIYSSNLCTEIAQNMSPTVVVEEILEDDTIITKKKAGDFVVCNLASLNYGKIYKASTTPEFEGMHIFRRVISIAIRGLDNVIDMNTLEVLQAKITSHKYRAIGLGGFGWHHLLALKGIEWESEQAVDLADSLYEMVAFEAITASVDLAKEKGAYPEFINSTWDSGEYFVARGYVHLNESGELEAIAGKEDWYKLALETNLCGIRNGHIMATAPNASTALLAGSTASVDPIYKQSYVEEKAQFTIPVVVPDLSFLTYQFYAKNSFMLDQRWSVRQNIMRQRHVDQAISFNYYVPNTIKLSKLLELHMMSWYGRVKTTYYTRSEALTVQECEWCAS
ncbi:ribonucleoside-diphosphate reductase subunit alpha 2 [Exiguobacterium phage vB_EalM-132]|nr:ribonucleoside-diphosphate reductase subunit alpha 2 [Exiguobacterium phage vB_EalM-132]